MNIYYVYFYIRSNNSSTAKKGTPYYIGKGKGKRAWNKHSNITTPKDKSKIILVEQNLTELQAFILERYFIRWFGRKDNETGILHNKTNGGDGTSGYKSTERNINISKANKGKIRSKETKLKISLSQKGKKKKPFTKLHKQNMSKAKLGNNYSKGKQKSEESKRKSSISNKNRLTVVDSFGICIKLSKEEYNSQKIGDPSTWKWVSVGSNIGKIRLGKSLKQINENAANTTIRQKGKVPCYNKQGTYSLIEKPIFDSQQGEMSNWEWVFIKTQEGNRRKSNRSLP